MATAAMAGETSLAAASTALAYPTTTAAVPCSKEEGTRAATMCKIARARNRSASPV